MGFSVGEDLFSVLVGVGLFVVFVATLAHAYHVYAERRNVSEDFGLALDITERLRDQVLAGQNGQLGSLELSHEQLESYSQILLLQGISLQVEVRTLEGELLFAHGLEPSPLQYFSPPVGVGLPATVQIQSSVAPCKLSVQIWRG